MNALSQVPPGFRFHPTEEELVDYYLRKQIATPNIDLSVIKIVDLYNIEPWDLQDVCTIGNDDENEWYFFSHKDKKYPTGTRTNRATKVGFWKATGRDKAIYSKFSLVGMRKTLVFYQGRAPNGQKSDWIMHEYRLETSENAIPQEEGWVVCRAFKKRLTTTRKLCDDSPCWHDDQFSFTSNINSTSFQDDNIYPYNNHNPFLQLPPLESPKLPQTSSMVASQGYKGNFTHYESESNCEGLGQAITDWRALDKFVASQLSQDDHAG